MKSILDQIKSSESVQELRMHLKQCKPEYRYTALESVIDDLNSDIEHDIKINNIEEALYAMSQVVMMEDQLHIEERFLAKKAVVLS
jgi:hypothetical protein